MATRPCRVIIAGGGLAGLSLALMLEKIGIDYLLLEAYADIVATAGAGIALLPNGLRVLDQLGCYEDIVGRVGHPMNSVNVRNPSGESMSSTDGWRKKITERYGYALCWMDRTALLQVLYEHIVDKSKLLTKKRVETVRHSENEVQVVTTDGSVYCGDILIGADGTHSRVRQEIKRHATELGLHHEYAEEDKIPATYGIMFGLSTAVPGISNYCLDFVVNKHYSYAIGSGEDRTYWFLMKNLGRTSYGAEIPRFSKEDIEKAAKEHWNDPISPGVRFSDLYESRREVIFTPMREFVYSKWYLDRMMVIGDAAHKMTSIIAQGGNQAFESAAAFVNALVPVLSNRSTAGRMSIEEIRSVFEQAQETRLERAKYMCDLSGQRQRMDSMETPELEDLMLNRFPKMMPGIMQKRWDESLPGAVSLHMLPIPDRPKAFPFVDERKKDEMDGRRALL